MRMRPSSGINASIHESGRAFVLVRRPSTLRTPDTYAVPLTQYEREKKNRRRSSSLGHPRIL